jgi:hypothetical protein
VHVSPKDLTNEGKLQKAEAIAANRRALFSLRIPLHGKREQKVDWDFEAKSQGRNLH